MTSAPSLSLRLRARVSTAGEPDIAAFCGRPRAAEPCVVIRPADAAGPASVSLFVATVAASIPAPDRAPAPPPIDAWHVRAHVHGHLAHVQLHGGGRRVARRRRAPWLVAACLPLSLAAEAIAAPAAGVQRPKLPASPTLPEASEAAATPTVPTTDAAIASDAPSDVPADGEDPVGVAEAPTDATPVPAPAPASSVVDAAWEGVDGFDVDVQLVGGGRKRGIVGAVQHETFTLIEHDTGEVFVMRKDAIAGLRVHRPKPVPTATGGGLIAGGVVLDVLGAPLFISGVVLLGVCPSCVGLYLPLTIVGAASLGAGIPITIRGARQRRKYLRAMQEHGLAFGVAPTREGWSAGLRVRF
ncbi:MAG: hypothetical protein IPH07_19315 [Deltaproteobacteria bacterium]|nr:hypothetical protein [Deltaproteobacteria bacterium]MBK8715854.1 hypothetical protein [Deltaproteobacteria bacterium]MBP7286584.1 hypothetical protein [Nannocystaceae bacterium]